MAKGLMCGIKITSNNDTIEFERKDDDKMKHIRSVDFRHVMLERSSTSRSSSIRFELEINGFINKETKDRTKQLADWAFDSKQSTLYRDVEIHIDTDGGDEVIRRYNFERMYVMDYIETFSPEGEKGSDSSADNGIFKLVIAQVDEDVNHQVSTS